MEIIGAKNVSFQYEYANELPQMVLKGVDLAIEKGSFVALLGSNGSGKSTLAKHFNAILLPTGGKVLVDGMDTVDEEKLYDIRRMVGMVLQNPDNQLVSSIVEEDVAFGPENLGVPPKEIRARVEDALRAVGMYEHKDSAPHKLSGGQKQRIAIAGVLAMQPDVLVLDEPTAMLDPKGRREVLDTVHMLNKERGMTVVLITHYMEEAAYADRVVVLDNGKLRMDGTPREIFPQVEALRELRLDVPQPTELLYLLRKAGFDLPADVLNEKECVAAILALAGKAGDGV